MSAGLTFSDDWQKWENVEGVDQMTADRLRQTYPTPLSFIEATKDEEEIVPILKKLHIIDENIVAHLAYLWWDGKFLMSKASGDGMIFLDGFYRGDLVGGMPHGNGKMTYAPGGDIYEGEWVHGKKEGHGKLIDEDGSIYEGEWKDDKKEGHGKVTYSDGDVFEGNFVGGIPEGLGTMKYNNGTQYVGDWMDGGPEGQGEMTYADGSVYEGEWVDGHKKGRGKMTYADGSVYEGDWSSSEREGYGKNTYSNGDVYIGEWIEDDRWGFGVLRSESVVYKGKWENDKRSGDGIIKYSNENSYFEGTFKNDRGTGKYVTESRGRTFVRYGFVSVGSYDFVESTAEKQCAICLEDLNEEEEPVVKIASCGHVFHLRCIRRWFSTTNVYGDKNDVCPKCRNEDMTLKHVIGNKTDGYKILY